MGSSEETGMNMNGNPPNELAKTMKGDFCPSVATEDNSYH